MALDSYEHLQALLAADPTLTAPELARHLSVTRGRIYQMLQKLGYARGPGNWQRVGKETPT